MSKTKTRTLERRRLRHGDTSERSSAKMAGAEAGRVRGGGVRRAIGDNLVVWNGRDENNLDTAFVDDMPTLNANGHVLTDGQPKRRCGDCTLCCTVMGVPDLPAGPKPPGTTCGHVCSRGCRIYADRPDSCREFACVWIQGGLPKWMRPDRVGMVFSVAEDGEVLVGFIDARRPDLWRGNGVSNYLKAISARGAESRVGLPAAEGDGKVLFIYRNGRELARPPEADEVAP